MKKGGFLYFFGDEEEAQPFEFPRAAEQSGYRSALAAKVSEERAAACKEDEPSAFEVTCTRVFSWAAFIAYVSGEVWIHAVHGIKQDIFDWEEEQLDDCGGDFRLCAISQYLTFAEGVCRVGLFMMCVLLIARLAAAVAAGRTVAFLEELVGTGEPGRCSVVPAAACSLATLCIGTWGTFAPPHSLPLWCRTFCHSAEVLCHAIVTSGLVGMAVNFGFACRSGHAWLFITRACVCLDTVEDHSVVSSVKVRARAGGGMSPGAVSITSVGSRDSEDEPLEAGASRATTLMQGRVSPPETLLLWLSFIFGTACYVLAQNGQLWDPLLKAMVWLGVVCWAGIAWWIVVNLLFLRDVLIPPAL